MSSSRLRVRRANRKKTGMTNTLALDEALNKSAEKDTDLEERINTSITNRDLNEPINYEAVKEEYKPGRVFRSRYLEKKLSDTAEQDSSSETSPYHLNTRTFKPIVCEATPTCKYNSDSDSDNTSVYPDPFDEEELVEDLRDQIQELQLKLKEKEAIIQQKDLEIRKLKRLTKPEKDYRARRSNFQARESNL